MLNLFRSKPKRIAPIPTITAGEKLMVLSQRAMFELFRNHLILRSTREPLDPVMLTETAHKLLDLASQAERARMRKVTT